MWVHPKGNSHTLSLTHTQTYTNSTSSGGVKDIELSKEFCRTKDANFILSVTSKIKQECQASNVKTKEKNNIAANN